MCQHVDVITLYQFPDPDILLQKMIWGGDCFSAPTGISKDTKTQHAHQIRFAFSFVKHKSYPPLIIRLLRNSVPFTLTPFICFLRPVIITLISPKSISIVLHCFQLHVKMSQLMLINVHTMLESRITVQIMNSS